MAIIDYVKEAVQGQMFRFPVGMPDANGISKTVINDSMILYIVASPEGANLNNKQDCIFLYAPLLSIRGLPDAAYKKLFMEVGRYGLPAEMSSGMRIGYEESSELLWVCQRAIGYVATTRLVADVVERFIQEALRLQPLLVNFVSKLSAEYAGMPQHATAAPMPSASNDTDKSASTTQNDNTSVNSYETPQQANANYVGTTNGTYSATVNESEITSLKLMSMGYALRV